ncbi:MAG: cytochrome c oxidase subunit 3 [Pseudomonadota bacterium]
MGDAHVKNHDYHVLDPSPWPIAASGAALIAALGAIAWMRTVDGGLIIGPLTLSGWYLFAIGMTALVFVSWRWWADVFKEAAQGDHTPVVTLHHRYGVILFIASEVMFFVAWFWAYFDVALFPGNELATLANNAAEIGNVQRKELTGGQWPPVPSDNFQSTFNPWGLPLVNTLILLLSGCTVTWAHHALLHDDRKGLIWGLALTCGLGFLFSCLQMYEYDHATFNFSGHIYGATFYMATGFHGAHVVIGTIFLFVCLVRSLRGGYTADNHFSFEAAAWYWHFVDVVWLFLFVSVYVWGAGSYAGGH